MTQTSTVLLVDDHPLLRKGLQQLLSLADDLEVVGEASNGADAVTLGVELDPDLILLDLNMPVMDGWEILEELKAFEAKLKNKCQIHILTSSLDVADITKSNNYQMVNSLIHKPIKEQDIKMILD